MVTKIPSIRNSRKTRVAAYVRVSSLHEEQDESYETQAEYYHNLIRENPGWELVDIYAERISGTRCEKREAFGRIIEDALAGRIDLILCKSMSRWGRNFLDSMKTIKLLTGNQVNLVFAQEDIDTRRPGELFKMNLSAAIAQSESESLSENMKWVYRERAKMGVYNAPKGKFFGYNTDDGTFKPDGNAPFVRRMFQMYAEGYSLADISRALDGVKTVKGNDFTGNTIHQMLENEIYVGDKRFGKKPNRNVITGEIDEVQTEGYVFNHHEGIVDRMTWNTVQRKIAERRRVIHTKHPVKKP